jgi:hypothetical protein
MFQAIVDVMIIFTLSSLVLSPAYFVAYMVEREERMRQRTKGDYCSNYHKK